MREMFSWYIDNSKYFTEDFSKTIIKYSIEAKASNSNITKIVEKYTPDKGNKAANITAARDFGIIDKNNRLSDGAVLYNSGFYNFSDFVLDQISKRNVSKSKNISLKPLVILAKVFSFMFIMNIPNDDIFLTAEECYKYLSTMDSYDEITEKKIYEILNSREYVEGSKIPKKAITGVNIGVYLPELFSALADSKLFDLGIQKSIIKPVYKYYECINFIAQHGNKISIAPTVCGRDNEDLYDYLCDINKGIKEIIPEIRFNEIPNEKMTESLYLYLFGISRGNFSWNKYFERDIFGVYRIFYPIERIVFAKIYTENKKIAENLCDFCAQKKPYVDKLIGGKLMILEPFDDGHTPLVDLTEFKGLNYLTKIVTKYSRNRILFGAPGTGKSFTLNQEKDDLLSRGGAYERVTFHPDYSYANFVGTYKPVPFIDQDGKEAITYSYVPGPFMRTYVEALKSARTEDPKPYLLIIEEINRANVASVFGDIFQLLDRDEKNVSEYPIQTSEDIKNYLAKSENLGGSPQDYHEIRLPDNLFIWATMNSADQGVFPMDTAFKRRWDFTYLGIDEAEKGIVGKNVILGKGDYARVVEWNELRKAINSELLKYNLNEDKLLGPYFISKKNILEGNDIDPEKFSIIFKNKVIMYLFDDAAKQKRKSLFSGCKDNATQYSKICDLFDDKGVFIFDDNISSQFIERPGENKK